MIRVQSFKPGDLLGQPLQYSAFGTSWGLGFVGSDVFHRFAREFNVRSDAEYIRTGRPVVDRDKDCDHLQCFGVMSDHSSLTLKDRYYRYDISFDMSNNGNPNPSVYQEMQCADIGAFLDTFATPGFPTYARLTCNTFGYISRNGSAGIPLADTSDRHFSGCAQLFPRSSGAYMALAYSRSVSGQLVVLLASYYPKSGNRPSYCGIFVHTKKGNIQIGADGNRTRENVLGLSPSQVADLLRSLGERAAELLRRFWPTYSCGDVIDDYEYHDLTKEKKLSSMKMEASSFGSWCLSRRHLLPEVKLPEIWGELAYQSIGNISHLDSNMIAYAKDLPEVGGTIKALINLVRNPDNPASWASAWLSARFADRLTIADTKEIVVAYKELLNESLRKMYDICGLLTFKTHARKTWAVQVDAESQASYLANYAVYYTNADGDSALMKAIRTAYEWDFYPTLGNLWDLVPYSFVADWFLNIGELFEKADASLQSNYYNFHKIVKSIKQTHYLYGGYPEYTTLVARSAHTVMYKRIIGRRLDSFCYQAEWSLPSSINVVDGASLILQKIS